jgi:hypothetical protein
MDRSELLAKIQCQRMWLEDIRGKSLTPQLETWKAKYLAANNLTHLDVQGLEQLLKALESMPKISVGDAEGLDARMRDRIKAGDYAIAFVEEIVDEEYF